MIEKFLDQISQIAKAIIRVAVALEETTKQLNYIRITLLKIEDALMNLDSNLEGPDDLIQLNPIAPESEVVNGGKR